MTAHDLIASIYQRPQEGRPPNERGISGRTLAYLKDLIGADEEGAAFVCDGPGVWLWTPRGRTKYRITEDLHGNRHSIARFMNLTSSDTGLLF
jgi:hypothetical protein